MNETDITMMSEIIKTNTILFVNSGR